MIIIEYDGAGVRNTNYFDSESAQNGNILVSRSGKAFQLLIPPAHEAAVLEMGGAHEVILTNGSATLPTRRGHRKVRALEFLFEDGSTRPFVIQVGHKQVAMMPQTGQGTREDLTCLIYIQGPRLVGAFPLRYRERKHLPCLQPWTGR